jgi:putative chitinase
MSLKKLQERCSVTPDGAFGPGTFKAAVKFYGLSDFRAAHFFAQTSHESGEFKVFMENLNYSSDRLDSIFPKYFKNAGRNAADYSKQPEKIANVIYSGRMGNGDEKSGDGWRYRGRGALQLTGKDNYKLFSEHLKKPEILKEPDLVATDYAFESALFFFERNKLWTICDKGITDAAIKDLTKKINGGHHGLEDRMEKTKKYYSWLQ